MAIISEDRAPVDDVSLFFPNDRGIAVSMLRLDAIDPVVSGNKWFKLKYNLEAALGAGCSSILTFGGAYSNHLVAAAAAAQKAGLRSIGFVRGLHGEAQSTATLDACRSYGMELRFLPAAVYRQKNDAGFLEKLEEQYPGAYIIPEGGDNEAGRRGAEDIVPLIPPDATHVCLPVGTGTTFAGIRARLPVDMPMTGFPAVKGGAYLEDIIREHLPAGQDLHWQLENRFHFGGFAKATPGLTGFIRDFHASTGVPLDIVYTGKMMSGIRALIAEGYFPPQSRVLCIHTGGLQGNPPGLIASDSTASNY